MSDEHADFLNGLHVVENELERVIGELDEMQDRNGIPALDRVSLNPLQWALSKLADDLHDANAEIRKARLEVVAARRGAEDAQELRDAARHLYLVECGKYNAEVKRRLALEKQVAEVTAERDGLRDELEVVENLHDDACQQVGELTKKLGELPAQPAPEPHQWQVGDEIEDGHGVRRQVTGRNAQGWVFIEGNGAQSQSEWERCRWKLHRKASDVPPTPQQVEAFAEVAEPINDSVGTNGEGQS